MLASERNKLREEIKDRVSVPDYFEDVIVPEMAEYYSDYPVDFEARPVAKCPLHHEDTPSFRYYEDSNTFYCFGCRAGGDVINLHRLFVLERNGEKPSFDEAILFLDNYFLKGRQDEAITVSGKQLSSKNKQNEAPLSTNVEVMLFYRKVSDTERLLEVDSKIPLDKKIKVYLLLDNLQSLVSLNIIPAVGAKDYLTQHINKIIYGR